MTRLIRTSTYLEAHGMCLILHTTEKRQAYAHCTEYPAQPGCCEWLLAQQSHSHCHESLGSISMPFTRKTHTTARRTKTWYATCKMKYFTCAGSELLGLSSKSCTPCSICFSEREGWSSTHNIRYKILSAKYPAHELQTLYCARCHRNMHNRERYRIATVGSFYEYMEEFRGVGNLLSQSTWCMLNTEIG